MKIDFEAAKQQVAERHGYESWEGFYDTVQGTNKEDSIWKEVFEIGCNEAVKADRSQIKSTNPVQIHKSMGMLIPVINDYVIDSLPLPFPAADISNRPLPFEEK